MPENKENGILELYDDVTIEELAAFEKNGIIPDRYPDKEKFIRTFDIARNQLIKDLHIDRMLERTIEYVKTKSQYGFHIKKDEMIKFEQIIDSIFEIIMGYGIKSLFNSEGGQENVLDGIEVKSHLREKLIGEVHKGWTLAQEQLYSELLNLNEQRKVNKSQLKKANIEKDKVKRKRILEKLKFISYKEKVFRKLVDTIAWQMLGMKDHFVKRLYNHLPIHSINNLNPSEKEYIDKFNRENLNSFALLADLTTFMQIGDILIVEKSNNQTNVSSIELKDGRINEEIRTHINSWYQTKGCPALIYEYQAKYGEKYFNQLKRMVKQDYKAYQAMRAIYEGKMNYWTSKKTLIIPEKEFQFEYYVDKINELLREANEKSWSIGIIEDCLYIGIYSKERELKDIAFYGWVRGLEVEYPIIDLMSILSEPLGLPPFLYPFSKENIIKMVLGEKKVFLCLDIDEWFKLGREKGLKIYWLNRKESTKEIQQSDSTNRPFTYEHRCIAFESKIGRLLLGGGMLAKIFYNFVNPSSILNILMDDSLYKIPSSTLRGRKIRKPKKIGRNEPCPCGSGKKFKKCCGKLIST